MLKRFSLTNIFQIVDDDGMIHLEYCHFVILREVLDLDSNYHSHKYIICTDNLCLFLSVNRKSCCIARVALSLTQSPTC